LTVHCEGDCHIVEQLGEKQDFEAALSRLGFRHEHFTLHVVRIDPRGSAWGKQGYSVTVANVVNERHRVYRGGSSQDWISQCTRDLEGGFFGALGQ
jgi:hypothetical protein